MAVLTQTYTFDEAIEILFEIRTREELNILASVIEDEKKTYTLVELRVFQMLFKIYRRLL